MTRHLLGSAFYVERTATTLTLRRTSDDTWAGETEINRRTAADLRRLADEIDGGHLCPTQVRPRTSPPREPAGDARQGALL